MVRKTTSSLIGSWAFLIGVILAIILALASAMTPVLMWVLVVVGLVVGFLNVADEETEPFLISGAVLVIVSSLGQNVVGVSPLFERILDSLLLIFVPATIVVAIKNVFSLARH